MPRFCRIASHQISIDVPLQKMLPAINALYRNLGNIIEKFANSPLHVNDTYYKEGRYYFWNESSDWVKDDARYGHGAAPRFPKTPCTNWQEYYAWAWQGTYLFVMRDGEPHTFKDLTMSAERFLRDKKAAVLSPRGEEKEVALEHDDIEIFFKISWPDFKPHFDLTDYMLDEFLAFWENKNMDGFFEKFCAHAYIEIRPCSPHFENSAMDIPKYFYDIFSNLDEYIKKSESIDWESARAARDKAILA